jgi:ribosomal protein S18 acetylase RimI-like enzyme
MINLHWLKGDEKKIAIRASHSIEVRDENSQFLGHFCLLFTGGYVSLWNFHIEPHLRGQGIGRKVLEFIISQLKEQNREKLCLYVKKDNDKAIKLYESFGFQIIEDCEDSASFYMELILRDIKYVTKLPHFLGNQVAVLEKGHWTYSALELQ